MAKFGNENIANSGVLGAPQTAPPFPPRVSQKNLAGNAAFQVAGVAEAPIQGSRLAFPPVSTYGCRQDAGAPRELGVGGSNQMEKPSEVNESLYANHLKTYHYLAGYANYGIYLHD